MLANYDRHCNLIDALLLTYVSKKRSEVAPGVGEDTDMFYVSNERGFNWVFQRQEIQPLEAIYHQLEQQQKLAFNDAKAALRRHIDESVKSEQEPAPPSLPPDQSK
jgi:hypothetical protein